MKYTVLWRPLAEEQLAELWMNARDREEVAQAADRIDAKLKSDPMADSESRTGNRRIMFVEPLVAFYDVREDDRLFM
jgi:hypothetical protein